MRAEGGPKTNSVPINRDEFLKISSTCLFFALGGNIILNEIEKRDREVYFSLLKFKAAELYAIQKNWPLVKETSAHFLIGNGSPLDITGPLFYTIRTNGITPDRFFAPLISDTINQCLPTSEKWSTVNMVDGSIFRFVGIGRSTLPDVDFSLQHFGVEVCGSATDPRVEKNNLLASFSGTVSVSDRYDFGRNDKDIKGIEFSNTAVVLLLRGMGVDESSSIFIKTIGKRRSRVNS